MFSYERIQKNLKRYQDRISDHDFLHQIAAEECLASLIELSMKPASVLILGHFPLLESIKKIYPDASYRILDGFHPNLQEPQKFDLIISIGQIQWLNDPQGYLFQVQSLLNKHGVFYAVFPGEDSFKEIHKGLIQAEMKLINGAHQRIIPMISASDALNLLQAIKFTNPLVHVVSIELHHDTVVDLLKDIKAMGGGNPFDAPATVTPKRLFALANQYVAINSHHIESNVDLVVCMAQA